MTNPNKLADALIAIRDTARCEGLKLSAAWVASTADEALAAHAAPLAAPPAQGERVIDAVRDVMHEVFKYADIAAPLRGPPMTQDESLPVRKAAAAQDKIIRDMLYALAAPQPAPAPVKPGEAILALAEGDPEWRRKLRPNLTGWEATWFAIRDIAEERRLLAIEVAKLRTAHPPAPAADGAGELPLYDGRFWQNGIAGDANIVTFNGEDIVGVARIHDDGLRAHIIRKQNESMRTAIATFRRHSSAAIAALRQAVPDAVRELPGKWRDIAEGLQKSADESPSGLADVYDARAEERRDCATELESALAASAEGKTWRCEQCGELSNDMDPAWRWTGDRWQHHHEAVGHVDARAFGAEGKAVDLEQFRGAVSLLHLTCRRRLRDVRKGVFPAHYLPIFEQDLAQASALLDLIDSQQESRNAE